MKNFIKLGVIGLAMSISLNAFSFDIDEDFQITNNQTKVVFLLGETKVSNIYNVKKTQDIAIHAPQG